MLHASCLSSRAQVTVVNQKERHSELAEESCRSHPRRPLARARFLGKLGMTFFFIRLLVRGHSTAGELAGWPALVQNRCLGGDLAPPRRSLTPLIHGLMRGLFGPTFLLSQPLTGRLLPPPGFG